jgi:hypothetical protein
MALEDRVAVLEDQMKILTNEIQSILLDIEEQILAHYYPELRAEESSSSEGALQSFDATLTPRTRETTEVAREPLPFASPLAQAPLPSAEGTEHAFTELVEWMGDSVDRIGTDRTRKLIEGYARDGHLTPGSRDILFQLISLVDEDNSPEEVSVRDMLDILARLNSVLGRGTDITAALSLLEEDDIG